MKKWFKTFLISFVFLSSVVFAENLVAGHAYIISSINQDPGATIQAGQKYSLVPQIVVYDGSSQYVGSVTKFSGCYGTRRYVDGVDKGECFLGGNATTSAAGLMSASDKTKLDGITASADSVSFSRSLTSGTKVGTITINGTGTDIYAPTQVANQNAFSNVTVGSTTISADTTTDTLTLVAGTNITLTPDATNDKVTIASTASVSASDILSKVYPIGAVYFTVNNINPASELGFGTWEQIGSKIAISENVTGNGRSLLLTQGTQWGVLIGADAAYTKAWWNQAIGGGTSVGASFSNNNQALGVPTKSTIIANGYDASVSGLMVETATIYSWKRTA